jgi:hypothetical protein
VWCRTRRTVRDGAGQDEVSWNVRLGVEGRNDGETDVEKEGTLWAESREEGENSELRRTEPTKTTRQEPTIGRRT